MKQIIPIKLTLENLEEELSRVKICIKETDELVNKKLSKERIKELERLRENLELLKSFGKIESKTKHLKFLKQREKQFKKAIDQMKKNKQTIYNPINGKDWLDE